MEESGRYASAGSRNQRPGRAVIRDERRDAGDRAEDHLDFSMTHLLDTTPEPGRAGALVTEALRVGAALRSEVVSRRAADFVTAAAPWRDVPEIAAVADSMGGWRTTS